MKAEKTIKKAILDFWKDSGKEWSCQTMTNEDMKRHCGFKNCLDRHVKAALSDLSEIVMARLKENICISPKHDSERGKGCRDCITDIAKLFTDKEGK